MPVVPPTIGQVWECLTEGAASSFNTLDFNRVRFRLDAINNLVPIGAAATSTLLTTWRNRWVAQVCPRLTTTYSAYRYNVQCISSVTPQPARPLQPAIHYQGRLGLVPATPDAGQMAVAPNPDFVTARVQIQCAFISRNTRGGLCFSPIADASVDGDTLIPAEVTAFTAAGIALTASLTDVPNNAFWRCVIFAGKLAIGQPMGVNFVNAVNFANDITTVLAKTRVGTQLHRKLRPIN